MSGSLRVFQYNFQPEFKMSEKKKRESNPFFLYRNYMKETAPKNIKMTELSKIASDSWKNLTEEEKAKWKRLYEINRDLPNQEELPQITNDREEETVEISEAVETSKAFETSKAVNTVEKVETSTEADYPSPPINSHAQDFRDRPHNIQSLVLSNCRRMCLSCNTLGQVLL